MLLSSREDSTVVHLVVSRNKVVANRRQAQKFLVFGLSSKYPILLPNLVDWRYQKTFSFGSITVSTICLGPPY